VSRGEKIFHIINYFILALIAAIALYPFIYVLSASLSSPDAILTGKVVLLPKNIRFDSYGVIFKDKSIWIAYGNTIFYTVVGTALCLFLTVCGAYALSKPRLRGRKIVTFFITITLWFDAGIIPFYLNLRDLGLLKHSRAAIIIAFACNAFNVILLRTFFETVPSELEEAARMDGANDLKTLTKVYLPLSKASLATVGLFYAIEKWNGYFWAMIIIRDENKIPLQVLLKKLIVENSMASDYAAALNFNASTSTETLTYATIIVSIIPILLVYPYIQKFFVKGVMIGAVKG